MKKKQILQTALFLCFLFADHVFPQNNQNPASAPLVSDIIVEIQNFPGDKTELTEIAKNLIRVRKGESFSPEQLQASADALKLCKKFEIIHVDSKAEEEDNIALVFYLTPFRYVRDIHIEGASPFFERDILNAMTVYIGDTFVQKDLPDQAALIEKIFRQEGFLAPDVKVTARENPTDGNFIIDVEIDRDDYYRVKKLEIRGNHAFSDKRLKLRMKTWMASLLPGARDVLLKKASEKISKI